MTDVTCPYCKTEQDINHDDGYGYEEDVDYEQDCVVCDKTFKFNTHITLNYLVECQDGDHEMEPFRNRRLNISQCKKCGFLEKGE